MAEHNVGLGLAGVYAGTLKANGKEWEIKNLATNEVFTVNEQRMRLDYLFDKIEKRRDALRKLMMPLVGDNRRYQTIRRYFDKIDEKIVVDCVTEYIDDEVAKNENCN